MINPFFAVSDRAHKATRWMNRLLHLSEAGLLASYVGNSMRMGFPPSSFILSALLMILTIRIFNRVIRLLWRLLFVAFWKTDDPDRIIEKLETQKSKRALKRKRVPELG